VQLSPGLHIVVYMINIFIETFTNIMKTNNYISAQIILSKINTWRIPMENQVRELDKQSMWRCETDKWDTAHLYTHFIVWIIPIIEEPTVAVKGRTTIKALFRYFKFCLSMKLDNLSLLSTSISWCILFKNRMLYSNTIPPVICEDWHFTHIWKTFACLNHFIKRGDWAHKLDYLSTFYYNACYKPGPWAVICDIYFLFILFLLISKT
jgi:hypothetical protein